MATTTLLGLSLTLSPPSLALLRIAPLLGTTGSLTHAWMEYLTVSSFLWTPDIDGTLVRSLAKDTSTSSTSTSTSASSHTPPTSPASPKKEALARAKQTLIPIWFTNFFCTGVFSVIGLNSVSLFSCLANLYLFPVPAATKLYYQIGLTAVIAHYAFVPAVAGSVERVVRMCVMQGKGGDIVVDAKGETEAERGIREWVGRHRVRMCSVDVVAWGAFVLGVAGAVTVL